MVAAKVQDLLQLNRDNERLTARVGQLETAGREAQIEARQQREHLALLRDVERQHRELAAERSMLLREQETLRQQLNEHQGRLSAESQRRAETELLLARAQSRLEAIEHTVAPATTSAGSAEHGRSSARIIMGPTRAMDHGMAIGWNVFLSTPVSVRMV